MLGKLLRGAADMADTATAKANEAWEAAKAKAENLRGDDAAVYDSALVAASDAITDTDNMTPKIAEVLKALREGNPYK